MQPSLIFILAQTLFLLWFTTTTLQGRCWPGMNAFANLFGLLVLSCLPGLVESGGSRLDLYLQSMIFVHVLLSALNALVFYTLRIKNGPISIE